jgi:ABC-2 type transport system permease protein
VSGAVDRWSRRLRKLRERWIRPDSALASSVRRLRSVARKELRQLLRDQLTMGFVVGVPAVQLLLFGYAINQDVRQVPTGVVDRSSTSVSRELIGQLEATQTFRVVARPESEAAARRLIQAGEIQVAVVVPPGYTRAYYRGRGAEILVLVDASDPILARAVRAAADGLQERHNARLQRFDVTAEEGGAYRAPRQRSSFGVEPELIRPRFLRFAVLDLYNPELRTPVYVVPALLGVILTTTMIMMTALALVRERERGSFEFLIATPVRRSELMAGKLLPYVGIGFVQIVIVVVTGLVLFRVPVAGSLFDLAVASVVFIAANLTLGLVISSVCASQLQATQLSFFFFLPSVLLSGFMFPFEAMPEPAQWLGEVLPLTHFIRICRGVLLRGSSLLDHPTEMAAMLLFSIVGFVAATRLFRKRLG